MSFFMNQPPRKIVWAVWGGLGVIVLGILAASVATQFKGRPLPVYGTLPGFTLTNQNGQTVTLADFRGQIWIADAIFTRCPGQCLQMSAHMKEIQDALPSGQPVRLVSFTTDPAFDQPSVLKKYAGRFGARDNRWSFLTGDKSALHSVEVDGLKLSVLERQRPFHPQRKICPARQAGPDSGLLRRPNRVGCGGSDRRGPNPGARMNHDPSNP